MKKILLSVLAIMLTVGVVSSAAYALFFDTVTVSGITFATGNADLTVTDTGTDWLVTSSGFTTAMNSKLGNLYPGFQDYTNMNFLNTSLSEIPLKLKMQLTGASGDWGVLNTKLYIAITPQGVVPTGGNWHTLAEWNAAPIDFGSVLLHDGVRVPYRVSFAVDSGAGNEIAQKSLTSVNFVLTGTQTP